MYDAPRAGRQSSISSQREPRVPPPHVLDRVDGRVLDPGTALAVNGIRPRSTVYVGPRLLVSRGPDDEANISTLEAVAERLQWRVTVSVSRTEVTRDEKSRRVVQLPHRVGAGRAQQRRALLR